MIFSSSICRLMTTQPSSTYYSVKRFIGQQLKDTQKLATSVSASILIWPALNHPHRLHMGPLACQCSSAACGRDLERM